MMDITRKPKGWLVGLAVGMIALGVVLGLAAIALVAKRKAQYRINDTNQLIAPGNPK